MPHDPSSSASAANTGKAVKQRLFGVCWAFPKQRAFAEKHCFGDCGHAIIGSIHNPEIGEILPCRQEVCPYLDSQMEVSCGEVNGEPLFLRKLKEVFND